MRRCSEQFINSRLTIKQFIQFVDYNCSGIAVLRFVDENDEVVDECKSNSPLLEANYDKLIESVDAAGKSIFKIWLFDEEYEVIHYETEGKMPVLDCGECPLFDVETQDSCKNYCERMKVRKESDIKTGFDIACDQIHRHIKELCNPYGKPTIDFEVGKELLKYIESMKENQ